MSKFNDILIIDDEKDICEQISGLLNDKGYETKSTLTSEDGISAFKIKNYSLVILDIWLNNSKLDGFQTLEKINNVTKESIEEVAKKVLSSNPTVASIGPVTNLESIDKIKSRFN